MKTLKINSTYQLKALISFLQNNPSMSEAFSKINVTIDLLEVFEQNIKTDLHFESHLEYLDFYNSDDKLVLSFSVHELEVIEYSDECDHCFGILETEDKSKLKDSEIEEAQKAFLFVLSQFKTPELKEEDHEFLNYLGFTDEDVQHYGKRFNHIHDIFFKDTQLEIK